VIWKSPGKIQFVDWFFFSIAGEPNGSVISLKVLGSLPFGCITPHLDPKSGWLKGTNVLLVESTTQHRYYMKIKCEPVKWK